MVRLDLGLIGGREQKALAEINRAHQLDPLSAIISYDLGLIHIFARRYDQAIAVCKKLASENPTYADRARLFSCVLGERRSADYSGFSGGTPHLSTPSLTRTYRLSPDDH